MYVTRTDVRIMLFWVKTRVRARRNAIYKNVIVGLRVGHNSGIKKKKSTQHCQKRTTSERRNMNAFIIIII